MLFLQLLSRLVSDIMRDRICHESDNRKDGNGNEEDNEWDD